MSMISEQVNKIRKATKCVYLAADKEVADDIVSTLKQAAETIEALSAKLQAANMENGGGWILCNERIPKSDENVLICFDFKGRRSVDLGCFWSDGSPHCDSDEYLTPTGRKERKAVAWMDLPKPYKGQP